MQDEVGIGTTSSLRQSLGVRQHFCLGTWLCAAGSGGLMFGRTPLSRHLFGGWIARNLLQALAFGFGEQEQGHN